MANGAFMVPALVQLLMQAFVPESPRWLVRHGRAADAELTLRRLYGKEGTGEVPIDVDNGDKGQESCGRMLLDYGGERNKAPIATRNKFYALDLAADDERLGATN